jgi:hypothetical protein
MELKTEMVILMTRNGSCNNGNLSGLSVESHRCAGFLSVVQRFLIHGCSVLNAGNPRYCVKGREGVE